MEERRRIALEASYTGIWDWDIISGDLYWDDPMFKIYDTPKGEFENSYDAWKSRLHPDDLTNIEEEIEKCLTNPSYRYFFRFRVLHKDEWRWVVGVGSCVWERGKAIRMTGINILENKDVGFRCPIMNARCPITP